MMYIERVTFGALARLISTPTRLALRIKRRSSSSRSCSCDVRTKLSSQRNPVAQLNLV